MKSLALIVLFLFSLMIGDSSAEKIAKSTVVLPDSNEYLKWDASKVGVEWVPSDQKDHDRYRLHLKGRVLAKKMISFAYQVNRDPAIRIDVRKNEFELDVQIDEIPSNIRLWMEVAKGKGIHIETYLVTVEKEKRGFDKSKLINY